MTEDARQRLHPAGLSPAYTSVPRGTGHGVAEELDPATDLAGPLAGGPVGGLNDPEVNALVIAGNGRLGKSQRPGKDGTPYHTINRT